MLQNTSFATHQLTIERNGKYLFKNLCFALRNGELLFIEGANGSGKTSLLRVLAGLTEPLSGSVLFNNMPINAGLFAEHLHYLGHSNSLQLDLTVTENLQCFLHLALAQTSVSFNDVLAHLQLDQQAEQKVRHLSAGQRRKVALARLLLLPRTIWLLDEPLASLDKHCQAFFLQALSSHQQRGGIAIISTHQALPFKAAHTVRLSAC